MDSRRDRFRGVGQVVNQWVVDILAAWMDMDRSNASGFSGRGSGDGET